MPPHIVEFVAVFGLGPFVFGALLMTAAAVRVWAGQDGATILAIPLGLVLIFGFALFNIFDLRIMHLMFWDPSYADSLRGGTQGYRFRTVGRTADPLEGAYWALSVPVILGLVFAILLPGRVKIFPVVGGALWLVLYLEGTLAVFGNSGAAVAGGLGTDWHSGRLEALRVAIQTIIEMVLGDGPALEAPLPEEPAPEGRSPEYPEGVSPLPRPRPEPG
ncbi:MAG: hypothetical protein AAFV96_12675 [Pseudomonadota bacterium]